MDNSIPVCRWIEVYAVKVVVQVRGEAKVLGISPDIVQDNYSSFTC